MYVRTSDQPFHLNKTSQNINVIHICTLETSAHGANFHSYPLCCKEGYQIPVPRLILVQIQVTKFEIP